VPSIEPPFARVELYILCGQVGLTNQVGVVCCVLCVLCVCVCVLRVVCVVCVVCAVC